MIDGARDSRITEEEFLEYAVGLRGPSTIEGVLGNLETRRENAVNGGVNCIPLPFERFRADIAGVEQGQYVVCTANQKVIF